MSYHLSWQQMLTIYKIKVWVLFLVNKNYYFSFTIFFPFLSGLMTKMGFVLRHWFWSFEDNSEGNNSKYLGPWFLSRWLDVLIKVHTLIEFLTCKTNLQPLFYWLAHQIVSRILNSESTNLSDQTFSVSRNIG